MKKFFRQFINVHAEELPQFTVLSVIYFIFIIGLVWSENAIRAEVVQYGLLANAQLISSIFVVVTSVIYTAYVDRIPKNRMVIILSILGLLGVIPVIVAIIVMQGEFDAMGYLLLFVIHRFFFYLWVIHWFTYIIDLYDTQAAKRIFPLLSAARPFATMFAGFSFSPITNILGVSHILLLVIWVSMIIAVTALFGLMPFILETQGVVDSSLTRRTSLNNHEETSGFKSLAEGLGYVASSSFLRWMAISALVLIAVNTIVEFRVAELIDGLPFVQQSPDPEKAFASFTALIDGVTNVFVLVFQFTLFNVILRRIGLGNMNLLYPILVFGIGVSLVIAPSMMPEIVIIIATLGYANYRGVRRVVRDPVFALLNNAVPLHAKGRARSVINAILSPTGGILAGVLLTTLTQLPEWILPVMLIIGCVVYLISSLVLRLEYSRAMLQMLQQNSFTFLLAQRNEIGVTDSATMQILADNIKSSTDPEFKVFMASIIAEIGGRDALPILFDMIQQADGNYRRDLIEVLFHMDVRIDEVRLLYETLLHDNDGRVRELAIRGLGRIIGGYSIEYLTLIHPLLGDDDIDTKATAIVELIRAKQAPYYAQAERELNDLLTSHNPSERIVALDILGKLDDIQRVRDVVPFLEDINDEVRLQATQSILSLWHGDVPADIYQLMVARVSFFMDDRVERVRLAELSLLAQINEQDSINALIRALQDDSKRIRNVAVKSLVDIGEPIKRQLLDIIEQAKDPLLHKMVSITLSNIDNDNYATLLDPYIESNLKQIDQNFKRLNALETCRHYSSVLILNHSISRQLTELIDDTFELMEFRYSVDSLDLIKESLKSPDGRTRSNAIEALESTTSPQLARRLAPMLNPNMSTKVLSKFNEESAQDTFEVMLEFARGDDSWLRAVSLYAFGEIGRHHPDASRVFPQLKQSSDLTVEMDACQRLLKIDAVAVALRYSAHKDEDMVKLAARAALRLLRGDSIIEFARESLEDSVLSIVERMIFLKKVSFFQGVSVDQLKVLSNICEEELYNAVDIIFKEGDHGDSLYIVVNGMVSIGIFSRSTDDFTELAVYRPNSAFGEMTIFDYSPRSASALAKTDVLLLRLRSEPLLALIYQEPDLSIELLRALSDNLRNANSRIASLTSTMRKTF